MADNIRKRHRRRAGFTILELLVSVTVFTIGIGAVSSTLVASSSLSKSTRETSLALECAQSAMESTRGEEFSEAFARFNSTTIDDPVAGTSPGSLFGIDALSVRDGDADGAIGAISFPGNGVQLREDTVDAELGMPRDLNGDGVIDALDHSGDYVVLPVRIRVEWTGQTGNRALEVVSLLVDS